MNLKNRRLWSWVCGAMLIACFALAPGIRGYGDWQIHEYVLFVALPIGIILYRLLAPQKTFIPRS